MPERYRNPGMRAAGALPLPLRAMGALPLALCLLCGCGEVRIAGGASEVGNPAKAVVDGEGDGSGESEVTGFGISARGMPVRVIRESRSEARDTASAAIPPDPAAARNLPDPAQGGSVPDAAGSGPDPIRDPNAQDSSLAPGLEPDSQP